MPYGSSYGIREVDILVSIGGLASYFPNIQLVYYDASLWDKSIEQRILRVGYVYWSILLKIPRNYGFSLPKMTLFVRC